MGDGRQSRVTLPYSRAPRELSVAVHMRAHARVLCHIASVRLACIWECLACGHWVKILGPLSALVCTTQYQSSLARTLVKNRFSFVFFLFFFALEFKSFCVKHIVITLNFLYSFPCVDKKKKQSKCNEIYCQKFTYNAFAEIGSGLLKLTLGLKKMLIIYQ